MKIIVTTGSKPVAELVDLANDLALRLAVQYIPRRNLSLDAMRMAYKTDQLLVVTKQRIQLVMPNAVYFFHIGMAKLRIKNLHDGQDDHMALAMGLSPGDCILDCTLGMGTDAIIASYLSGQSGRVVGLEASIIVAEIVRRGLQSFDETDTEIVAAMRRIEVIAGDYLVHLRKLPAKSFDIVYFDPMFRRPIHESSGIAPLRLLANSLPVCREAVAEAIRVARKRVVLKEAVNSPEFARLGFRHVGGGKYSSVMYGYIEPEERE